MTSGAEGAQADVDRPEWPPRALAERLTFLLKHALIRMMSLAEPALERLGIDGREFGVLLFFAEEGALSQQEAAQRLGIDRTTMVALIDGLQSKDLVERHPHREDRRKNSVSLTEAGHGLLTEAARSVEVAESRFLAPLTDDEARRFTHLLQVIIAAE